MQYQSNFTSILSAVPDDDLYRTWSAERTIMLRRTSKRVKELIDMKRLPVVVCLNMRFWNNICNSNSRANEKIQLVTMYLNVLVTKWNITSLEVTNCIFLSAQELLGVVEHLHISALTRIVLNFNKIDEDCAEMLTRVLRQCPALTHVDLGNNHLSDKGVESLARVIGNCNTLAYLNLKSNNINNEGAEILARVLAQCQVLTHLDISNNWIDSQRIEKIARVIPDCPSLVHVNLCNNLFEYKGSEYEIGIEKMFEQCGIYFNIESNYRYDRDYQSDDSSDYI